MCLGLFHRLRPPSSSSLAESTEIMVRTFALRGYGCNLACVGLRSSGQALFQRLPRADTFQCPTPAASPALHRYPRSLHCTPVQSFIFESIAAAFQSRERWPIAPQTRAGGGRSGEGCGVRVAAGLGLLHGALVAANLMLSVTVACASSAPRCRSLRAPSRPPHCASRQSVAPQTRAGRDTAARGRGARVTVGLGL